MYEHTNHALCLHPSGPMKKARLYLRRVDYYNIHADNLLSFLDGALPGLAGSKDGMVSQFKSYAISLRGHQSEAAAGKRAALFETASQNGFTANEMIEFNRLFELFTEHAVDVFTAERDALGMLSMVSLAPNTALVDDGAYMVALTAVNEYAGEIVLYMSEQSDSTRQIKEELGFLLVEYSLAVRSGQDSFIDATKDAIDLTVALSLVESDERWDLGNMLDTYAALLAYLENTENDGLVKVEGAR